MKLAITQMVLEHAEFKHREDYMAFPPTTPAPTSRVRLSVEMARTAPDARMGALVRLSAVSAPDAIYQFVVRYVVFYNMEWDEGEQEATELDRRLIVTGSTMLFPFVRETVANLTGKGRFGPTWLAPTSFQDMKINPQPVPQLELPGVEASEPQETQTPAQ